MYNLLTVLKLLKWRINFVMLKNKYVKKKVDIHNFTF